MSVAPQKPSGPCVGDKESEGQHFLNNHSIILSDNMKERLQAYEGRHAVDFALVLASQEGSKRAVQLIVSRHFDVVRKTVASKSSATIADEVISELGEMIVVGELSAFCGKGSLRSWLTTAALRKSYKKLRAASRAAVLDWELPSTESRSHVDKTVLKGCLAEVFSEVASDELELLTNHYVERLPLSVLSKMYDVSKATLSRRLRASRTTIQKALHAKLQKRLGLPLAEVVSWIRDESFLSISLEIFQKD